MKIRYKNFRLWIISAVIILLLIIISITTNYATDKVMEKQTYTELGIEEETVEFGGIFELKNLKLSVTNTSKINVLELFDGRREYMYPQEGYEFIVVTVKFENISTSEEPERISYSPDHFNMINSNRQSLRRVTSRVVYDNQLPSGQVLSGGTAEGCIIFEQPVNDKNLMLEYNTAYGGNHRVIFDIFQ